MVFFRRHEPCLRRSVAQANGDQGALKLLKETEARLERRRVRKNLFIQAVSDATDFDKVRSNALQCGAVRCGAVLRCRTPD